MLKAHWTINSSWFRSMIKPNTEGPLPRSKAGLTQCATSRQPWARANTPMEATWRSWPISTKLGGDLPQGGGTLPEDCIWRGPFLSLFLNVLVIHRASSHCDDNGMIFNILVWPNVDIRDGNVLMGSDASCDGSTIFGSPPRVQLAHTHSPWVFNEQLWVGGYLDEFINEVRDRWGVFWVISDLCFLKILDLGEGGGWYEGRG